MQIVFFAFLFFKGLICLSKITFYILLFLYYLFNGSVYCKKVLNLFINQHETIMSIFASIKSKYQMLDISNRYSSFDQELIVYIVKTVKL